MLFSTFFMRQCLKKQFWRMYKMTGVSSVFTNKQEDVFPQCTSLQLYTTPFPPPSCVLERIVNWENVKNIFTWYHEVLLMLILNLYLSSWKFLIYTIHIDFKWERSCFCKDKPPSWCSKNIIFVFMSQSLWQSLHIPLQNKHPAVCVMFPGT